MNNILTFDVEDWYQGFKQRGYTGWENLDSNEGKNIQIILDILERHDTKATFFILGNYAKKNGDLIKKIFNAGHEIGSHSYSHNAVGDQSIKEFTNDLRESDKILSDLIGKKIVGYRAPRWSLNYDTLWALEILCEYGYLYDSSFFPSNFHPFGNSKFIKKPFLIELQDKRTICELPAQTVRFMGMDFPAGGGFYFRAAPLAFTKYALTSSLKKNMYSMVYLHPYEFEKGKPPLDIGMIFRFIRYFKLSKTKIYLNNLMENLNFVSCEKFLERNRISLPTIHYSKLK